MYKLENEIFSIAVKELGAELVSAVSKTNNLEYMWSAVPKYWGRVSPILFPVVGGLKDGGYRVDGKEYTLPRHGFLREENFELKSQSDNQLVFAFSSNDNTLACYPFAFEVRISYTLIHNQVVISWEVENKTKGDMYFSIGGHPAFQVPLLEGECLTDYSIAIKRKEGSKEYDVDRVTGYLSEKGSYDFTEINLTNDIFEYDALVFSHIDEAILENKHNQHKVTVRFHDFPYVGFWSQFNAETREPAPFVCIEPWYGIGDFVEHDGDLKKKTGIICLKEQGVFKAAYEICFE